jgi:hypothetical protein
MPYRPLEHYDDDEEEEEKNVTVEAEYDVDEDNEGSNRWRFEHADAVDRMDAQMGFVRHMSPQSRKGWLINMHAVSYLNKGIIYVYIVILNL